MASRRTAKTPTRSAPGRPAAPGLTAAAADRHELYEAAVQNVESEIDFVDATFLRLRGRRARRLREDFCGTGNTSCEWVRRRPTNEAWGLDIDAPTLAWGQRRNIGKLDADQAARVNLLERDVLTPGDAVGMDAILAMNFSYWLFTERATLLTYFRSVRESLGDDGLFFCDFYGGSETMKEMEERRRCSIKGRGRFTYVWDQHRYTPVTGAMHCRIHFEFPDGTAKRNAFSYHWRLWTLPEIRELLAEAGFRTVAVYWEGDDGKGGGNGVFRPTAKGTADPAYICYIVSEK